MPYLSEHGLDPTVRPFVPEHSYQTHGLRGLQAALGGLWGRAGDLAAAAAFDVVLVHREAWPVPIALPERLLAKYTKRLVFDFDDAIYLRQPQSNLSWLRSPRKFGAMVGAADLVIAGNELLAERASQHNKNVVVIPTPVDCERITPKAHTRNSGEIVIGWMGSPSSVAYLEYVAPALNETLTRHPNVHLAVVGARAPRGLRGRRVTDRPWYLERETYDLRSFDIGIMPLPDDEWTRGKCGYKLLQYMAAGLPTVASPVGIVTELTDHGQAGLLAASPDEWVRALSELVEDSTLRRELGARARFRATQKYSLNACAPLFLEALTGKADAAS